MRLEFLEPEELDKISEEEWDYITYYTCEVCSGSHDWTEEAARNLQLYGRGGDLLDEIEDSCPINDSIFDFYNEEFGHPVYPGDDTPEEREVKRGLKLLKRFVDDILFWYFVSNSDAMQAHKDWVANTPEVQEWKEWQVEFQKRFSSEESENDA